MEVLILGGDSRYLEIIKYLSKKNNVDVIGYNKYKFSDKVNNIEIEDIDMKKYDIIFFPINGVNKDYLINCEFNDDLIYLNQKLLSTSKDNVLIFSGIRTNNLDNMLNYAKRKCIYLMNDEDIIDKNAISTVEGIISDVIINTPKTIYESNILVLGYGHIGTLLTNYLNFLGANICVGIILQKDKIILNCNGINNFYTYEKDKLRDSINKADVIINTVPSHIIEDCDIKYINQACYVLDISSYPHGFNKEILDNFYIKNKLYLGIPGKVAPITSGKILVKKINEILEEN